MRCIRESTVSSARYNVNYRVDEFVRVRRGGFVFHARLTSVRVNPRVEGAVGIGGG